jgi:hypothetical protein
MDNQLEQLLNNMATSYQNSSKIFYEKIEKLLYENSQLKIEHSEPDFHDLLKSFYKKIYNVSQFKYEKIILKIDDKDFTMINFLLDENLLKKKQNLPLIHNTILNIKSPNFMSDWRCVISNKGPFRDINILSIVTEDFKEKVLKDTEISHLVLSKLNYEEKIKNYFSTSFIKLVLNDRMQDLAKFSLVDIFYKLYDQGLSAIAEAIEEKKKMKEYFLISEEDLDQYLKNLLADVYFCLCFLNDLDVFLILHKSMQIISKSKGTEGFEKVLRFRKFFNVNSLFYYVNGVDFNKLSILFKNFESILAKISEIFDINITISHISSVKDL